MAIEQLKGKPWYIGLGVGLGIAALLFGLAWWQIFTPQRHRLESQQKKLSELQTKIQEGRAAKQRLPQFREEVRRLELELDKLLRILPARLNTEDLLRRIRALAEQGDLEILKRQARAISPIGSSSASGRSTSSSPAPTTTSRCSSIGSAASRASSTSTICRCRALDRAGERRTYHPGDVRRQDLRLPRGRAADRTRETCQAEARRQGARRARAGRANDHSRSYSFRPRRRAVPRRGPAGSPPSSDPRARERRARQGTPDRGRLRRPPTRSRGRRVTRTRPATRREGSGLRPDRRDPAGRGGRPRRQRLQLRSGRPPRSVRFALAAYPARDGRPVRGRKASRGC